MKQLLIDTIPFQVSPASLNESYNKNGRYIVTGVIQRADVKNQNGRVYPRNILEREIQRYIDTEIKENRAFGELDHPDSSVVELKNTSHIIRNVYWKGDDVIGVVEILNTPTGNILKAIVNAGCTIGISSRGMGSVSQLREDGTLKVEDDFNLICWDFVSNPSTHGAFMSPNTANENTINESVGEVKVKNYKKVNSIIRDIICEIGDYCEC